MYIHYSRMPHPPKCKSCGAAVSYRLNIPVDQYECDTCFCERNSDMLINVLKEHIPALKGIDSVPRPEDINGLVNKNFWNLIGK